MIKRTLYFGNPSYLHLHNDQLLVRLPEIERNDELPAAFKKDAVASIPIEDIGVVVLDHQQITITQALLGKLLDNNCAVISCDEHHHPAGLMMPLCSNTLQSEKFRSQIDASVPLKKQLWQQTIATKIRNQAALLKTRGVPVQNMLHWADSVKSGDSENHEARAAAYYWKNLFPAELSFLRGQKEPPPNNLLNYGYAILRAIVARALVGSGLLPTLGIHHHNKYNAYCLADDIMEPYRPYVDAIVLRIVIDGQDFGEMTASLKKELLAVASVDVVIEKERSPLMVGMQRTTASLVRCYEGSNRKLLYPELTHAS